MGEYKDIVQQMVVNDVAKGKGDAAKDVPMWRKKLYWTDDKDENSFLNKTAEMLTIRSGVVLLGTIMSGGVGGFTLSALGSAIVGGAGMALLDAGATKYHYEREDMFNNVSIDTINQLNSASRSLNKIQGIDNSRQSSYNYNLSQRSRQMSGDRVEEKYAWSQVGLETAVGGISGALSFAGGNLSSGISTGLFSSSASSLATSVVTTGSVKAGAQLLGSAAVTTGVNYATAYVTQLPHQVFTRMTEELVSVKINSTQSLIKGLMISRLTLA